MSSFHGYHANDKMRCCRFIGDRNILILSTDDKYYLGTGMYFWDNKSNAKYWYYEKTRKMPGVECAVVTCEISTDHMLDLTDEDVRKSVLRIWKSLQQRGNLENLTHMGKIIDMIYRASSFLSMLNIIKMIANYGSGDSAWTGTYVATNVRTMYCVRNCSPILNEPSDCTGEVLGL